ncbi:hypothetical protein GCM10010313_08340 [Streptomyces violarus]|nr:hypothetical protein GCM10010313_08340 [Streptomyces violarus]
MGSFFECSDCAEAIRAVTEHAKEWRHRKDPSRTPEFAGNAFAGRRVLPWVAAGRQPTRDRLSRNRFLAATVNPCPVPCAFYTGGARGSPTEASIQFDGITGSGAQGWARA